MTLLNLAQAKELWAGGKQIKEVWIGGQRRWAKPVTAPASIFSLTAAPAGKGGFIIAFGVRFLRGDPGYHHRLRLRQIVVGQFAVENLRFTDDIQFGIGTNGGELGRSIERRVGAEGFVIVE